MGRKKKLKVNGSCVADFVAEVKRVDDPFLGSIDKMLLEVSANGETFKYDIRKDTNHPDISVTKDLIAGLLHKARDEHLNLEINEDRSNLRFRIQKNPIVIFTGFRL